MEPLGIFLGFFWKGISRLSLCALIFSVGLWLWHSENCLQRLPASKVALCCPNGVFQVCVGPTGFHLLDLGGKGRPWSVMFFTAFADVAAGGQYPAKHVVLNVLGFTVAGVPADCRDGDMEFTSYSALVIPYWFIIALSGMSWLGASGRLRTLVGMRFSRTSKAAMAVVLLFFLIMNGMPRLGGFYLDRPWLRWVFNGPLDQQLLGFGFPFECFRTVSGDGRRADDLRRDHQLGWKQEKAMENLIIAVLAALAVGFAVERLKSRKPSALPPSAAEPSAPPTSIMPGHPPAAP
ncbi:MAG: hypothetical protein HYX68_07855 [Planctomycetes bacterium]|nr:hypothetical protein [Planctomycetota bacterium]